MTFDPKAAWQKASERERLHMTNVARRDMPLTIALLEKYPAGPEREQAFKLLCAGIEESTAAYDRDTIARAQSLVSSLGLMDISTYLQKKP